MNSRYKKYYVLTLLISLFTFFETASAASYLTLSSFSGPPGETIKISGAGLNDGTVNIEIGNSNQSITTTTVIKGFFSATVKIPDNAKEGSLSIRGIDSKNNSVENTYYVVPLQPSISIETKGSVPGSSINITGNGFGINEQVLFEFGSTKVEAKTSEQGKVSATIVIPQIAEGLHQLIATGQTSEARATGSVWVSGFFSSAYPSTFFTNPGGTVSFSGSGFAPGEKIKVIDNDTIVATFLAGKDGSFKNNGTTTVPIQSKGQSKIYTLSGETSGGLSNITIEVGSFFPYASPSSSYLLPGQIVSFSGGGFAPNEIINLHMNGSTRAIKSFRTDSSGGFGSVGSTTIPFRSGKSVEFKIIGTVSGGSLELPIETGSFFAQIYPSEYHVQSGKHIGLAGSGFAPQETVLLSLDGNEAGSVTSNEKGAFIVASSSSQLLIPFKNTPVIIEATGKNTGVTATVEVIPRAFLPLVSPDKYLVIPGDNIVFSGSGFAPNESITLQTPSGTKTIRTDTLGEFRKVSVIAPYSLESSLDLTFIGVLSKAQATINIKIATLAPYLTATSYHAIAGTSTTVVGNSFAAQEKITVTAGDFKTTTTTDKKGMTTPVKIPLPFKSSTLTVRFDGTSSGSHAELSIPLAEFIPSGSSDSYHAVPGSIINITGNGFASDEDVVITIGDTRVTAKSDSVGAIKPTQIKLPFDLTISSAEIVLEGQKSGARTTVPISYASFNPLVVANEYYVKPGSTVTFTGSGFAPFEKISVSTSGTIIKEITSNKGGAFKTGVTVPFGSNNIEVSFTGLMTGRSQSIPLTLAQLNGSISLSTYYATGGSPLIISGYDFASNEKIEITIDGKTFSATAKTDGTFILDVIAPHSSGDKHISARGTLSGIESSATITVAPVYTTLEFDTYTGKRGQATTISGSGYLPHETIEIISNKTADKILHRLHTDSLGSFKNIFTIPSDSSTGDTDFTIISKNSNEKKTITFHVTR